MFYNVLFVLGDVIIRRHTVEMSEQYRDQLAKAIYGRLFSYLVNCINDYLQGQDDGVKYVAVYMFVHDHEFVLGDFTVKERELSQTLPMQFIIRPSSEPLE